MIAMNRKNIYYWLLLPVLALMMGACSESNNNEEPVKPDTPVTPIDSGDWQTVPATGGTIEKGDIALTFPAGTFSSDTKVAITEVKKGTMGGDLEASPFYQITMPATTAKPITVKVKSAEEGDDIGYVISTPGWATSAVKEVQHESFLDTEYADGEYATTLPVFDNGKDPGNESFTIGLGHLPRLEDTTTKSTTRADWKNSALKRGTVDGVTWEIYMGWKAWWKWKFDRDTLIKAELWTDSIAKYIEASIKQIHKLGFKLEGKDRTIYYYYNPLKDEWGSYEQDSWNNNWWSCINLNAKKLAENNIFYPTPVDIKQTIIHETLHYYQSDYDPRYWSLRKGLVASVKAYFWGDGEDVALTEIGAVWIEKFMNNGKLNGVYQLSNGLGNCFNYRFRLGVPCDKEDIVALADTDKKNVAYQQLGYALAPLLYYMTGYKGDDEVIWLYKNWKSEDRPGNLIGGVITKPIVNRLDEWYNSTFGFFDAERLDNYYISLFKGDVIKEFSITSGNFWTRAKITLENKLGKDSLVGKVHPNGCEGYLICLKNFAETDLENYELVVKQKEKGVHTQVLYTENIKTVKQITGKTVIGDSIIISGETLKSMVAGMTRNKTAYLFLLTTRDKPSVYDKGTVHTNTWVELRKPSLPSFKASPTELTFEAKGGEQTVKIDKKSFLYCGGIIDDCEDWVSIVNGSDDRFTVKAAPNTTDKERTGTIYAFATNTKNPTAADIKLLPIKVTQKARAVGEECWVLVNTEVIKHEDTTGDRGQYMNYSASETELRKEGKVIGKIGPYKDVDKLFDLGFVTTIQAPPTTLNAGDTLRIHITAKRTTDATIDKSYNNQVACYDYIAVEMWWNIYNSSGYFGVENLDGPKGGPSSYSTATTSSWDYVYRVPSGRKDKEESVYLTACGSKVIWTYRWGGTSD